MLHGDLTAWRHENEYVTSRSFGQTLTGCDRCPHPALSRSYADGECRRGFQGLPELQLYTGLLRDGQRRSICISTQVGCAMGCVFCASGLDGVDRNLTSGEIVEQMLLLQRLLPPDERLSNIVVMGMGEPLANLDNLLPALDEASADDGLGIGHRRITISTVGLPRKRK